MCSSSFRARFAGVWSLPASEELLVAQRPYGGPVLRMPFVDMEGSGSFPVHLRCRGAELERL